MEGINGVQCDYSVSKSVIIVFSNSVLRTKFGLIFNLGLVNSCYVWANFQLGFSQLMLRLVNSCYVWPNFQLGFGQLMLRLA